MRRFVISFSLFFALTIGLQGATGKVMKVLPQFLDLKGRSSLSPSLYDRDAYQAQLQQHPQERSTMRFEVEWKSRSPVWEALKLRLQMRGVAKGNEPKELALEVPVEPGGWLGRWDSIPLTAQQYKDL